MPLIIFLLVVGALIFWVIAIYNALVSHRNRYKNAFAQIDVQLKRRYDLIPNLVETAKAYLQHERGTLEAVIAARSVAVSANRSVGNDPSNNAALAQMSVAEGVLSSSLGKLMVVSEAYPELRANENMMQLTEELSSTENKIAFSRQAFNDSVMEYNNSIEQFPGSFIANMFGFKHAELLQATEAPEERKAVKVSF
jgi:LemA protein